jgi:hypothetical protein
MIYAKSEKSNAICVTEVSEEHCNFASDFLGK